MAITDFYKKQFRKKSKVSLKEFVDNIKEADERAFFVQAFSILLAVAIVIALAENVFFDLEQDPAETVVGVSFATLIIINLLFLRVKRHIRAITIFVLVTLTVGMAAVLIDGGFRGVGIYGWYVYPAIAFFLVGLKRGIKWVALLYAFAVVLLLFDMIGWVDLFYSFTDIAFVMLNTAIISMIYILYEKNREKAELRSSQFVSIVESMGTGIFVVDDRGNIMFLNKKSQDLLKYKEEDLLNKKFTKAIDILDEEGNNMPDDEWPLDSTLKNNTISRINCIFKNKNEEELDVVAIISPISSDDKALGAVISFYDAGQEKELERARSEFISLASHELRTPLSIINMNLEMLSTEEIANPSVEQYLDEIQKAARSMNELASTLLGGAALKFGKLEIRSETIDLREVIDHELDTLSLFIKEKGININKNIPENINIVHSDLQLVRIVVLNLLSNAVKYNKQGGSITISLSNQDDKVLLKVADTGKGIASDEQKKIFSRKFRGKEAYKGGPGAGIGLYTVRSILENIGGNITFESEEGRGTTFFVELPIVRSLNS